MKILIDFVDSATQAQIDSFCAEAGLTILKTFSSFGKVFLAEGNQLPEATDLVESIVQDADAPIQLRENLSSETEFRDFTVNEDNWWKVSSYWEPEFEPNATMTVPVNPICFNVYVMDSGIDLTHPEFVGQSVSNLFSVDGDDFTDYNGHGTALASVITGNTCSFSRAHVHSVKIFRQGGTTTRGEIIEALDTIKLHLDANPGVPGIINASWAIPFDEYINSKFQWLMDRKVMVVAAAGNSAEPVSDVTPATITDVFTVSAYDENFVPADFANYTSDISNNPNACNHGVIDFWAPGTNIRVARPGGGYGTASGTSMSAAIVSGAAAYNISTDFLAHSVSETGSHPYWENQTHCTPVDDQMLKFIKHRTNVLDMSDLYNQATNRIVTFNILGSSSWTNSWLNYTKGTDYRSFFFKSLDVPPADHTGDVRIYLCDDSDVETAEMVSGALPPGLIYSRGFIHGKYTGALLGDVSHEMYNSGWKLVSWDGTVTTFEVEILVQNHKYDEYPMPEDDAYHSLSYHIELMNIGTCANNPGTVNCFQQSCQPIPTLSCEGPKPGCNCAG